MEKATFAGGCFWCTEAIFQRIAGVKKVVSGYAGGKMDNPSYEAVSTGGTGHAEAIQITFDPKKVTYADLLYIFFATHDPTTFNRQGADVGTQYRSAIFYENDAQKMEALSAIEKEQEKRNEPIVTEVVPLDSFYEAEDYHQNYYNNNPDKIYCKLVIDPKIKKLERNYKKYLA